VEGKAEGRGKEEREKEMRIREGRGPLCVSLNIP